MNNLNNYGDTILNSEPPIKCRIKYGVPLITAVLLLAVPAFAADGWDEQKGANFVVYSRDVPQEFVQTVLNEAEEQLGHVTQGLGVPRYESWGRDKRAFIYIYRDQEDYVANGGLDWAHGSALGSSKTIKTYPAATGFFDSVLPHELSHIVLHEFVGASADVPSWLDEGLAMYHEKARRVGAHRLVRKAIENGQFIPLTQLTNMQLYKDSRPEAVELYYAEAASVVNFMMTQFGPVHVSQLCRALKDRLRFEQALAKVFVPVRDLEDLNKRWRAFVEEQ